MNSKEQAFLIENNKSTVDTAMSAPSKRAVDKHVRRERSSAKHPQHEEISRSNYLIEKLSDFFMFD